MTTTTDRLPRFIAARVALRATLLAVVLSIVVAVLQLARAFDSVSAQWITSRTAASVLLDSLPAIATVALPCALLVALGLTFAELAARGELVGWSCVGRSRWELLRPSLALSCFVAVAIHAPLAFSWGPHRLAVAASTLERGLADAVLAAPAHDGRAVARELRPGAWLSARAAGGGGLAAIDVRVRLVDEGGVTQVDAEHAELLVTGERARFAAHVVPPVETWDLERLLLAAAGGDSLARGQIAKRSTLVALTPVLAALLLVLVTDPRYRASAGATSLAAFAGAACIPTCARGIELMVR